MAGVDLEAPEIDVDENEDEFRKSVAVVVALIAFFAIVIAFLQAVESNQEDRAARDAQRASIDSFGTEIDSESELRTDTGIADEIGLLRQRQAVNAGRVQFQSDDIVHAAAADRYDAVQQALLPLTTIDPADPASFGVAAADAQEAPDAAGLLQTVLADRANDHGGKADSYVAVLTVLAVGLFLLGISLTVEGRARWVLAGPGVAIAVVCILATGLIAKRPIREVSERATDLVAQGQRAATAGDFDEAISLFDEAIADSPDFATAFARRGDAHFAAGLLQSGQTAFPSITTDDARRAALADLDTALSLGGGDDFSIVGEAGFLAFVDRDFERAASLSERAIELNGQRANVHFNLGVARVALGDADGARRAYLDGIRLLERLPSQAEVPPILAGARTDLSVLRDLLSNEELADVDDIILREEGRLAEFEAGLVCAARDGGCADPVPDDATVGDATFAPSGVVVVATVPIEGADDGESVEASWYFRTDPDLPFEQAAFPTMDVVDVIDGQITTVGVAVATPLCPIGAEYLVRLYADDTFIGEVTGEVGSSPIAPSFTSFVDPLSGLDICSPEGFDQEPFEDPDFGRITKFVGDDVTFFAAVVRGLAPGDDPLDEATRFFVSLGLDPDDLTDITLRGRTLLSGTFVDLPGFAGNTVLNDGTDQVVAIAFDSDGTLRSVLVSGTTDPATVAAVVQLVLFTDLPEA